MSGYLFCNGILIGDFESPPRNLVVGDLDSGIGGIWSAIPPTISVTDNNGGLPLDLARKGFVHNDGELSDHVIRSICAEFLASLFYANYSSPSELAKFLQVDDFMVGWSWVPIIFGKNGFAVLDEPRLIALAPKKLIVLPDSQAALSGILQNSFIDDETFVLMHDSYRRTSPSNLLYAIRQVLYGSPLPNFAERYGEPRRYFTNAYYIFDRETFKGAAALKKAPKYMKSMLDEGYTFGVGDRTAIVVSQDPSLHDSLMLRFSEFISKRYAKAPAEISREISLVCGYTNANPTRTVMSELWDESFCGELIPYDPNARNSMLRAKAPILEFRGRRARRGLASSTD